MHVNSQLVKRSASILIVMFISGASLTGFAEKRLLYPQEQALKSIGNKVSRLVAQFKVYSNLYKQKTFTKKPEPGLGILDELTKVEEEFKKANLPEDNQKVKNVKTWLVSLRKNTPILEKAYTEGYNTAQNDPKNAPLTLPADYEQDVARLKTMYKNYKDPSSVFRNITKAKEVVPKFQEEYAFFQNIPVKYEALLKAKKAKSIPTWIRTNEKYMIKFKEYQDSYVKELPAKIEASISAAEDMAAKAKDQNKPMFFKGGVKQNLDQTEGLLAVLEAIKGQDDESVKGLDKRYQEAKKQIDSIESAMAEQLLASVQAPADAYSGSDKSTLKSMIEKEWKKLYPKDDILAIRFHSGSWTRNTEWKWNNSGWYKVDKSVLPVKVVVKTDEKIATIYPAFINKDHLKSDAINVGAHTKERGYVIEKMLLKNFK